MLVVHNSIPIDSPAPSDIEAVAIHLHNCNYVIYVSPLSSFQSILLLLENLVTKGPVVLVGDFNLPVLCQIL